MGEQRLQPIINQQTYLYPLDHSLTIDAYYARVYVDKEATTKLGSGLSCVVID